MAGIAMDICPEVELLPPWRIDSPEDWGIALWTNSKFKDFKIIIGDRAIDVHKCVLAARSPVFAAKLTPGSTETKSGQLKIQDFDFDTVQNVIWFLYSDRFATEYSTSFICELLRFGHKYNIQHLTEACINQINYLSHKYTSSEKKLLLKSAEDLGQGSEQILNSFKIIFEVIEGELDQYSYPEIGDVLFQDDSFKDLKIICDDGQEFFVYKCILALESPVFAQMFDKMAQTQNGDKSGRLPIKGFKTVIVETAVEFWYTRYITVLASEAFHRNPDFILGLLKFADKFKMEELASFCLNEINKFKKKLGKEVVSTCIATAATFESKKIFHFILEICRARGFDPFDFEQASSESYWN